MEDKAATFTLYLNSMGTIYCLDHIILQFSNARFTNDTAKS